MSIGNDIVDLREEEGLPHPLRFASRVLCARELEALHASPKDLWKYWAAKEAAYKAFRRLSPQLPFFPKTFSVDLTRKEVWHNSGLKGFLHLQCTAEYIHALVQCSQDDSVETSLARLSDHEQGKEDVARENPSLAVRKLLVRKLCACSHIREEALSVLSFPQSPSSQSSPAPELLYDGQILPVSFSLSHHGAFIACAFSRADIVQ
jgi:phosphopantetheinyl transferase (holo-ACP synthase)